MLSLHASQRLGTISRLKLYGLILFVTSKYSSKNGSPRSMMTALSVTTLNSLDFRIVSNSLERLQRTGYGQWCVCLFALLHKGTFSTSV